MTRGSRPLACIALLTTALTYSADSAARLTQRCNTDIYAAPSIVAYIRDRASFGTALSGATTGPAVNDALWNPVDAHPGLSVPIPGFSDYFILDYSDVLQDMGEVVQSIKSSTLLAQWVTDAIGAVYGLCILPPPQPPAAPVVEYYNNRLGHYFLSSDPAESAALDAGGGGGGWERTGESFKAKPPITYICGNGPSNRVVRFYGKPGVGPNTHFFTADPDECGGLRRSDAWIIEGSAFGAYPPVNGTCANGLTPVYRLYNNRWMFNDTNHRYVTRVDLYQQMITRGWIGEGIAMCVEAQ